MERKWRERYSQKFRRRAVARMNAWGREQIAAIVYDGLETEPGRVKAFNRLFTSVKQRICYASRHAGRMFWLRENRLR